MVSVSVSWSALPHRIVGVLFFPSADHASPAFRLGLCVLFCFKDPATPEIYTLSLHDALPISLLEQLSGASEAPPIVLVDDAHESDPDSLRALLFCARRLVRTAVLIVLVVRGDAAEALPGEIGRAHV